MRQSEQVEIPFATFVLEKRLAVGGMSEVFLARRREEIAGGDVKHCVLKRILPDLVEDDAIRELFELEAKLHGLVKHPSIVEFQEYGTYAGEPYIVMDYVEGVVLSRLMKRARAEERQLNPAMCVYVARRLLAGLAAVHAMVDERGHSLNVVHRDVTPSNILLSKKGVVKLGDFGIAHVSRSVLMRTSVALKGKYAYLAPEQVSGDIFDHRADLFSLAVVLAEMLIGGPLFPGAGQLAVLLAIRDARLDALRAARDCMPEPLFDVLVQALSRAPEERFQSASALFEALAPFEQVPGAAMVELSGWVCFTADNSSAARQLQGVVRETLAISARVHSSSAPTEPDTIAPAELSHRRSTLPEENVLCMLRSEGRAPRPVHLPKLIEMLATGQVKANDQVDFGDGFHAVETVSMLARYLPPPTATTRRLQTPGVPDFFGEMPETKITDALTWVVRQLESGVLFAEPSPERPRTELYWRGGKLVLAVSSEPSMLLGERLVAKGLIDRAELELAVLVMHKYNGQLGDTLIGLGLVDPMEVFQAIRAQGRERVGALFKWTQGSFTFYRDVEPARVDFRLDLDVPGLLLAGLTDTRSNEQVINEWQAKLEEPFAVVAPKPAWTKKVTWPSIMLSVLRELSQPTTPRHVVHALGVKGSRGRAAFSQPHVLLAIEACHALAIIARA